MPELSYNHNTVPDELVGEQDFAVGFNLLWSYRTTDAAYPTTPVSSFHLVHLLFVEGFVIPFELVDGFFRILCHVKLLGSFLKTRK
ncbi:MAG: hypothetical protein AAGF87_06215 [Bacteroidota bacterium]